MPELLPVRILSQWERDFATWLSRTMGKGATREMQRVMLSRLKGTEASHQDLLALKVDPEFRAFLKECRHSEEASVAKARQLAHNMYSDGMKLHHKAIKQAMKKEDYRAAPPLTEPIWKRVLPLREEGTAPTNISITLTSQRLADLTKPPIDVEVEELPPPADERNAES